MKIVYKTRLLSLFLVLSLVFSLFSSTTFASAKKIDSIKDIKSSVYVNNNYSLPGSVAAIMSDKSTQKVSVKWNTNTINTSKTGTFIYKGTVKGYAKQVLLTLKILPASKYKNPELERAVTLGIGSYAENSTITYKLFFQMLDRVVKMAKPDVLAKWQKKYPKARLSNNTMRREEGMLAVYFAAEALGSDYNKTNAPWWEVNDMLGDSAWEGFKWDYPLFPDWDKPVVLISECDGATSSNKWKNYMTAAYFYAMGRASRYSDALIFDYDSKKNSMRPGDPLRYEEALLAALRLYDSSHIIIKAETAKSGTVTMQTLALAKKMPRVSNLSQPNWYGSSMEICNIKTIRDRVSVIKEDIAEFADMGFNYLRLMLYYPDFTEDRNGTLVFYQDVLENIDRIVDWCAEYKIHLCIDMHTLPGYTFDKQDILENRKNYEKALLIWNVLSSRYADIPSSLISYNLVNEPGNYFSYESYAKFAKDLISVIRKNDKANKLLVSDGMLNMESDWVGACPSSPNNLISNDIMQTLHLYPWHSLNMAGFLTLEKWPYEHAPAVNNYVNGETPFDIKGDFKAGTMVTLYINNVNGINRGRSLQCMADGKEIASYSLDHIAVGKDNCISIIDDVAEFGSYGSLNSWVINLTVPSACSEISIGVSPSGIGTGFSIDDLLIRLPSDTMHTYGVPDNAKENGFVYETAKYTTIYIHCADAWQQMTSSIKVNTDGSYTVENEANADVFDYETLRAYIKKWADWSKSTGTPILCNEFGVPVSLSKDARIAYMRSVLDLLKEYDIPWCIYTNANGCWTPAISNTSVTQERTVLPADKSLKLKNGFWYDTAILELLRNYMKR